MTLYQTVVGSAGRRHEVASIEITTGRAHKP